MGCSGAKRIKISEEETYVMYREETIGIQNVPLSKAIQTLKKYSKEGSLSTVTFATALAELGLIKFKDGKVDVEELRTNKKIWTKFFGCLSDYRDRSGDTFNTLNVVMAFILLSAGTVKEKVAVLYENLDWQCRSYVPRNMIRLFIKNFCVVAGEISPYYAEDTCSSTTKLPAFRALWVYAIEKEPEALTKKVTWSFPRLNKKEFMDTFTKEDYEFLFNSITLRRHLIKTYREEYEQLRRTSPKKPRLSVYKADENAATSPVVVKKITPGELQQDDEADNKE